MIQAPIALFVYNRPEHTRQTVEALKKSPAAAASDLTIFSDAARDSSAIHAVSAVRGYLRQLSGFKSITLVERVENYGLAKSIVDGVTRLSQESGRVIVLEDDLTLSSNFLEYMNFALDRYAAEDRVMQVAGHMFPVDMELEEDALLLPFISSWGWATWERAWRHFDPLASGYARLLADLTLRKKFDLGGHYQYFRMLHAQQQGKSESWAIRWYLSVFMRNGLALYPRKTLVKNLGFDGSGVNCAVSRFDQEDIDQTFHVRRLPRNIEISTKASVVFNSMPVPRLSLRSIANKVVRLMMGR
jgi:hypothetical protein